MRQQHSPSKLILCCLLFAVLSSCSSVASSNANNARTAAQNETLRRVEAMLSQGQMRTASMPVDPVTDLVYGKNGEYVTLKLEKLTLPVEHNPIGMLDAKTGLFSDSTICETIWSYDFTGGRFTPLLQAQTGGLLSSELAFSADWLVWIALGPLAGQPQEQLTREARLMARDLSGDRGDIVIDTATYYTSDGFALPFSSLSLDANNLAYRYTYLQDMHRMSQVRLADLDSLAISAYATVSEQNGMQIGRCSVSQTLLCWEVQHNYLQWYTFWPNLPISSYSIYCYQLDSSQVARGESAEMHITNNDLLYAPLLVNGRIFALNDYQYNDDIDVVRIEPLLDSAQGMIMGWDFSEELSAYYNYEDKHIIDRTVQRGDIFVGKRLLTWQSNIHDQRYVCDLDSATLVELPLNTAEEFGTYREDNGLQFTVRAIPALDADYLLIEPLDYASERYLMKVE